MRFIGKGFVLRPWKSDDALDLSTSANNTKIHKNMCDSFLIHIH